MSNFTKEKINKYANDLLIGLTDEERDMIQEEFDVIELIQPDNMIIISCFWGKSNSITY